MRAKPRRLRGLAEAASVMPAAIVAAATAGVMTPVVGVPLAGGIGSASTPPPGLRPSGGQPHRDRRARTGAGALGG